jgi:subtilisin family serine protease
VKDDGSTEMMNGRAVHREEPTRTEATLSFKVLPERWWVRSFAAVRVLNCLWLAQFSGFAQSPNTLPRAVSVPAHRVDRILIQPKARVSPVALSSLHSALKVEVLRTFESIGHLQVLRVPDGETVPGIIARYQRSGLVEFAEPDFTGRVFATPNDPKFMDGTLWGLNNTGQNSGTVDADVDAPEAWDVLTSASNVVVAVLDTGVRYTHEDLAANMWVNPNGGGHGTNALAGTSDPSDDSGHGTSIAGILGAVGNNGKGVTGVSWQVQIMACKCFDNFGVGNVSSVVACLDYARVNGARIINASWGFTNSLALSNAFSSVRNAGIIVVAAAGNVSANIDDNPTYPASYDFDNVVSVAYTTRNDSLGANSNYGARSVDLAAPGEQIYSTFGATDSFYFSNTGSSFAAPYVTGAFSLVLAKYPAETHQQIIARVLNGTDPLPALTGKCVTGGRLNLRKALSPPISLTIVPSSFDVPLQVRVSAGPDRTCVVESSSNLTSWSSIVTNTTSATGTFDFIDDQPASSAPRFFRAGSDP